MDRGVTRAHEPPAADHREPGAVAADLDVVCRHSGQRDPHHEGVRVLDDVDGRLPAGAAVAARQGKKLPMHAVGLAQHLEGLAKEAGMGITHVRSDRKLGSGCRDGRLGTC